MIHRQPGKRSRIKKAASFACAGLLSLFIICPARPASAGEVDRSTLPAAAADPAKCDSPEPQALRKNSGECKRISGYIAAGARFGAEEVGGVPSPFGPLNAPEFVGAVRAAGAALIAVPAAGLDRIFLPPNAGNEAR
jgi:hypothetical protein